MVERIKADDPVVEPEPTKSVSHSGSGKYDKYYKKKIGPNGYPIMFGKEQIPMPERTPEEKIRYGWAVRLIMEPRFGHREWMDALPPLESIGLTIKDGKIVPLPSGAKRVRVK